MSSASGSPALDAAMLRWLDESTAQGYLVTDRDLIVRGFNRWMEMHSGLTAAQAIGRSLLELWPDLISRGLDASYRQAVEGRTAVISQALHGYLVPMRARAGVDAASTMPQSAVIAPLLDDERAVVGTITTIEDVSERMVRETELRRQIQALEAAGADAEASARAKDAFLATLSHELRTPLTSVLGWVRIIRGRDIDPAKLAQALEVIERNASAQVRLINDMLDMSRIIEGKLRLDLGIVDVGHVALAALDIVTPAAAAKGVQLSSEIEPGMPTIVGDGDRLQQVVWNVLSNAVKFTPAQGAVSLRVRTVNGGVAVTVADTGDGIEPAFLSRVFDRFSQGDPGPTKRQSGLGLGLSLVRQLVELHGGNVRVESAGKGKGTTVHLHLPTPDSEADSRSAIVHPRASQLLAGVRVLVVEGDPDSLLVLKLALESHGAEATGAGSTADALNAVAARGDRTFDALIVDLRLPDEDGFVLIEKLGPVLRRGRRSVPAVAMTAYHRPEDRARALAAGYHLYLVKPFDPTVLMETLADLVKRAEVVATRPAPSS